MIAGLSVVISGAALRVSIVYSRKQADIQARLAAIEEDRRAEELASRQTAELTANFETRQNSAGRTTWHFVIRNLGPAAARNIGFEVSEAPGAEGRQLVDVSTDGYSFPLPLLDPGQSSHIPIQPVHGDAPEAKVTLRWEDDSGPREKVLVLNVF